MTGSNQHSDPRAVLDAVCEAAWHDYPEEADEARTVLGNLIEQLEAMRQTLDFFVNQPEIVEPMDYTAARARWFPEVESNPASEPEPELEHDPATGWRKGHEGVWSFRGGEWNRLDVPNQERKP